MKSYKIKKINHSYIRISNININNNEHLKK